MKLLLDDNLCRKVADLLRAAGHDVVHAGELDLRSSADEVVIAAARTDGRVLISADTDFGLARSRAAAPSFVLIRRTAGYRAADQARLLIGNLAAVQPDLAIGAIVVLGDQAVRIRRLPISGTATS